MRLITITALFIFTISTVFTEKSENEEKVDTKNEELIKSLLETQPATDDRTSNSTTTDGKLTESEAAVSVVRTLTAPKLRKPELSPRRHNASNDFTEVEIVTPKTPGVPSNYFRVATPPRTTFSATREPFRTLLPSRQTTFRTTLTTPAVTTTIAPITATDDYNADVEYRVEPETRVRVDDHRIAENAINETRDNEFPAPKPASITNYFRFSRLLATPPPTTTTAAEVYETEKENLETSTILPQTEVTSTAPETERTQSRPQPTGRTPVRIVVRVPDNKRRRRPGAEPGTTRRRRVRPAAEVTTKQPETIVRYNDANDDGNALLKSRGFPFNFVRVSVTPRPTTTTALRTREPVTFRNTQPETFRNTQPETSRNTQPATFRSTQPATIRNTQPATFRNTQPSTIRNTQPATFRNTQPATFRTTQPASTPTTFWTTTTTVSTTEPTTTTSIETTEYTAETESTESVIEDHRIEAENFINKTVDSDLLTPKPALVTNPVKISNATLPQTTSNNQFTRSGVFDVEYEYLEASTRTTQTPRLPSRSQFATPATPPGAVRIFIKPPEGNRRRRKQQSTQTPANTRRTTPPAFETTTSRRTPPPPPIPRQRDSEVENNALPKPPPIPFKYARVAVAPPRTTSTATREPLTIRTPKRNNTVFDFPEIDIVTPKAPGIPINYFRIATPPKPPSTVTRAPITIRNARRISRPTQPRSTATTTTTPVTTTEDYYTDVEYESEPDRLPFIDNHRISENSIPKQRNKTESTTPKPASVVNFFSFSRSAVTAPPTTTRNRATRPESFEVEYEYIEPSTRAPQSARPRQPLPPSSRPPPQPSSRPPPQPSSRPPPQPSSRPPPQPSSRPPPQPIVRPPPPPSPRPPPQPIARSQLPSNIRQPPQPSARPLPQPIIRSPITIIVDEPVSTRRRRPPPDSTSNTRRPLRPIIETTTSAAVERVNDAEEEEGNALPNVRGVPGEDYPIYAKIPETSFICKEMEYPGFYADMDTGCQVYHSCHHRRGLVHSFLCPNGTIFSQEYLICDWWYNVKCGNSDQYYTVNKEAFSSERKKSANSTQNAFNFQI